MIDWLYNRQRYTPSYLRNALMFRNLGSGWPAIVAFVLGYAAMVPFMNTSIVVGPVATALHGADLAFYVGFIITAALYFALRTAAARSSRPQLDAPARKPGSSPSLPDQLG
jgi:NCS1 family nucleobase:cation symporter-1